MATIQGMGATPTPLDFAEVYQGLRSGIVDGQDNPAASIFTGRFQEVQSHLMLTSHIFGTVAAIINESTFKRLKPEQQKAMIEAGVEAGKYADEQAAIQDKEFMDKLRAAGMTIVGPEQGLDVEAFRSRVRGFVIPKISEKWPAGLADRVSAAAQ
jgi:TRAP-type C4-dicarboxylate transport system substrate-binding protein